MFELTKKTEYGLQLMVYLARNFSQEPVSLKQIVKVKKLPYRFLSQTATDLKKAGLIKSKEGAGGGYFLSRKPKEITVAKILEVLEGPIGLVECLQKEASCPWSGMCGQRQMFFRLKGIVKKVMESHSLADLVGKEK
ncbi:MAG: Rrf2 family transcriptional regulator [Candidatus Pacebacteria bacterium]|nr:Rrf2 family transcriptional regulator [Candidatus Paceibacterota bacterium]